MNYVLFNKIKNLIKENYFDNISEEMLYEAAVNGMIGLLDNYSYYINKSEMEVLKQEPKDIFYEIGILLEYKNNNFKIKRVLTDSACMKAGLLENDIIISVNNVKINNIDTKNNIIPIIKNKNKIYIEVQRNNINIRTEIINNKAYNVENNIINHNIGYVKITDFACDDTISSSLDIINNFQKLDIKNLILDLRDNIGGKLNNAIEIANCILPKCKIVTVKNKYDETKEYESLGKGTFEKIVVLINKRTASAAEVLAGAVQQTKIGLLIGTQSCGKTSTQKIIDIGNGDGINLTIGKYYFEKLQDITGCGLTPNIQVNRFNDYIEIIKDESGQVKIPLIRNSIGPNVIILQQILYVLNYYSDSVDGILEINTLNALNKFKKDNNIANYGVVDSITFRQLKRNFYNYIYNNLPDNQLLTAINIFSE